MSLENLQNSIELILSQPTTAENAAKQRTAFAQQLAAVIDEYVQEQIGARLSLVLDAITIQSDVGASLMPQPGAKFNDFVRTAPTNRAATRAVLQRR